MTEETETPNCGRTWKRCVALSSQKKKVLPLLVFIAPSFQLCQSLPSDTGQEWNEKIDDIVEDGLGMPDDDLMEIPNTLDEQEDEEAEAEEAADQDEDHLDRYQETATGEYAAHPLTPQQGSPFASNDFELESDYTSFAPSDQIGCGNDGTSSLDESTFSTSVGDSSFSTSMCDFSFSTAMCDSSFSTSKNESSFSTSMNESSFNTSMNGSSFDMSMDGDTVDVSSSSREDQQRTSVQSQSPPVENPRKINLNDYCLRNDFLEYGCFCFHFVNMGSMSWVRSY